METPVRGEMEWERGGDDAAEELAIIEPLCAVFRRRLKAEGLKYTPERARILDAIIQMDEVFEAEALLERMKSAGFRVSKATIYRTIRLLADAGIIQQVLLAGDQAHYQLAYGRRGNTLLVRMDTGEVEVLEMPELVALRDAVCRARGLRPEGHRLQIFATKA